MPFLTIRFIFEPDIVSDLIGWFTDSLFCHTEALSRDGKSWIGAHAKTGVQARPLNWTKVTRERQYAIPVSDEFYEKAMTWLESKIGTPYNYADIVDLAVHSRRKVSDHEIICSALMSEYCWRAEVMMLNVLEGYEYLVTPETLHLSPEFIGRCIYSFPENT